jgi:hypothetical protein
MARMAAASPPRSPRLQSQPQSSRPEFQETCRRLPLPATVGGAHPPPPSAPAPARIGEHPHAPGMDVRHRRVQLLRQVPAGQVDIAQRRVRRAVPGEGGDRVHLRAHGPARASPGYGPARRGRPPARAATRPRPGSTAAFPSGTPAGWAVAGRRCSSWPDTGIKQTSRGWGRGSGCRGRRRTVM